eukprot:1258725-Amorphochlora_amoeboformis.AAC.1
MDSESIEPEPTEPELMLPEPTESEPKKVTVTPLDAIPSKSPQALPEPEDEDVAGISHLSHDVTLCHALYYSICHILPPMPLNMESKTQ